MYDNANELTRYRKLIKQALEFRRPAQCDMKMPWYKISLAKKNWRNGNNFGDDLNVDLASSLLNIPRERVYTTSDRSVKGKVVAIGSVLTHVQEGDLVFGTGLSFFSPDAVQNAPVWKRLKHSSIYSLRGLTSRLRASAEGVECRNSFGDLGLAAGLLIWPELQYANPDVETCVVPHTTDFKLKKEAITLQPAVRVLDISPSQPIQLMTELLRCKRVISSSLHAIMAAQAFNISSVWYNGIDSNKPEKYWDYFSALHLTEEVVSYQTLREALRGKSLPQVWLSQIFDITLRFVLEFPFDEICFSG